ncbi:MAG: hypothetical protein P8Z37_12725 [Acidobacteriota bacterium]|jgi:TM2 domain-containing membrane protein YozV
MDKVWVIPSLEELLLDTKEKHRQPDPFASQEKNPAIAYSWSVFFWGGGQFYNNRIAQGLSFLVLMAAFYSGIAITILYWPGIVRFLHNRGMSVSVFLLIAFAILLCGLIFRSLCCSDAYNRSLKNRINLFTGMQNRAVPFICSILIPGWGQFLNGQPLKGSIFASFSVVSYFSLIAVPVTLLVWKDLEPSFARFLVESIFTIAIFFLPLIPFIWIWSSYDALKVSLEEWKKQPLWLRIKAATHHCRNRVWVRRSIKHIKRTFALAMFLVFLLIMLVNYSPGQFYFYELASTRSKLQLKGMTLLPNLLGRMSYKVAASGS